MEKHIAVIPGDGIGPEIVKEAVKVLDVIAKTYGHSFVYTCLLYTSTMRQEFEILSSGDYIEKPMKESLTYREMDQINHVYSFL